MHVKVFPKPVRRAVRIIYIHMFIARIRNSIAYALIALSWLACASQNSNENAFALELSLRTAPEEGMGGGLFSAPEPTLYERIEQIRLATPDDSVQGIFLQVGPFDGSYAVALELGRALNRFRDAKKPVHCHFVGTDNAGYALLASSCDRISVPPSGLLNFVGVRVQAFYARDFLNKFGINAEMLQVGQFKGAADIFTENAMPDAARSSMTTIMQALQENLFRTVASGRKLNRTQVANAAAQGPLTADNALIHQLVDHIEYVDESKEHLRNAANVKHTRGWKRTEEDQGFFRLVGHLVDEGPDHPSEAHVALVPMVGTISSVGNTPQDMAASDNFVATMRRLRDNKKVAAVVLRIDSPGGSAVASDRMWHAVFEMQKSKPVIASVGNMAASGGYYIAAAATKIFAEPASLIGSIGVVGGKIAAADLAQRLGIHGTTLRGSPNAAWSDPTSTFTNSERAAVQVLLDSTYKLFLNRVTLGRKLRGKALDEVAQGRLWDGQRALAGGLVDTMGGLVEALNAARRAANLPMTADVYVWPPKSSPLSALFSLGAGTSTQARLTAHTLATELVPATAILLAQQPLVTTLASGAPIAAALPFGLHIN